VTDDRRPAGFVSAFRAFSKLGNVALFSFRQELIHELAHAQTEWKWEHIAAACSGSDQTTRFRGEHARSMLSFVYANIQVKNIPERLHNKLRRYAREQEITLGEIVLEAIEREVARREWHKRFTSRPTTRLRSSAAELLEQERRLRDSGLS